MDSVSSFLGTLLLVLCLGAIAVQAGLGHAPSGSMSAMRMLSSRQDPSSRQDKIATACVHPSKPKVQAWYQRCEGVRNSTH